MKKSPLCTASACLLGLVSFSTLSGFPGSFAWAAEPVAHGKGGGAPGVSQDATNAMKSFKFDEGLKVDLFAAEPLLANPVAFSQDAKGRWYIAETYRQERGIEDNRGHANWLEDDIAARTTADRLAMIKKFYPDQKKFEEKFTQFEDRITRLEDTNGDGVADRQTVFADGFRDPLDGTGAGILARGDEVWWTCIPNLWRFQDKDGDGKAEVRDKLLSGFGVKFAFRGHDMHGLRFGPDGKLYFSIGDRGISVKSREGVTMSEPDTGSIMRCNPDGSAFEVFATGVRNPQELAFNEYGDLFTGDNNSDSGDKARFLHLVEGGEYGWRMTYQYLNDRGPWNREMLWDQKEAPKARYLVPTIANIGNGPSGLTYNPGTALGPKYRQSFFLSDFRGGASASVIHQIRLEREGAGYKVAEVRPFVRGVLTTDCEFGNDGQFYVLDWVESWGGVNKGRIYKFSDANGDAAVQKQTASLILEGMGARQPAELAGLLGHEDQRIRQAAQFALAALGESGAKAFIEVAADGKRPLLARLHAVWGMGQGGTKQAAVIGALTGLLSDTDAEVRAQSAKVLGELREVGAGARLVALLKDAAPRVRFFAALSLGKIGHTPSVPALFEMLAENKDEDALVRHAAVMGLRGCAKAADLAAKSGDGNASVRIGAVLALRRLQSPEVAVFLKDKDEAVSLEAARAVHDAPIEAALPALAALSTQVQLKNPRLLERVVNAHYRLGGGANARALAAFAGNGALPAGSRREALEALAAWGAPSARDRLLNLWRPLPDRPATEAVAAVGPLVSQLLKDGSATIQEAAAKMSAKLGINAGEALAALAEDEKAAVPSRLAALQALVVLKDPHLGKAAKVAFSAKDAKLRSEGLKAVAALEPGTAVKFISEVIATGQPVEKQAAVKALADIQRPEAAEQIGALLEQLAKGQAPAEVQLEILEAAQSRPQLKDAVAKYRAGQSDPLDPFKLALVGGNADRGRKLFREKVEVQCLRCHKCEIGDSAVGPELTKIGASKDRLYLLESIVYPNKTIAQGFATVVLTRKDGSVVAGRLLSEEGGVLRVESIDAKGKPQQESVPAADLKDRISAPSPMPETTRDQLTKAELRDLVEYLATRK